MPRTNQGRGLTTVADSHGLAEMIKDLCIAVTIALAGSTVFALVIVLGSLINYGRL